jgi:ABC-type branched-subunit amino acid transport system substrate-binding protein
MVRAVKLQGLTGDIAFTNKGDRAENSIFVLQVDSNMIPKVTSALRIAAQ